jgi:hypothetical protein
MVAERGIEGENGQSADQVILKTSGNDGCSRNNVGEIYLDAPNSQLVVCDGSKWKSVM